MSTKLKLEEAVIARFAEIGFPKQVSVNEKTIFDACYLAFAQRGWVFIYDTRPDLPFYGALPPETPASCLRRLPKV